MTRKESSSLRHHSPYPRYLPVIGPKLKLLLLGVFGLFALLSVDSVYLASITVSEWITGEIYQDYFYQLMFLLHLVLGLLIILPVIIFGIAHMRRAWQRPNRRAVRAGLALFSTALVLLISGIVLTRFEFFEINDPNIRNTAYWIHVVSPLVVAWLFVLHRLAGKRIKWRLGLRWAAFAGIFAIVMLLIHIQGPGQGQAIDIAAGEKHFSPSLARTATGHHIPAQTLMMNEYCEQCHEDVTEGWSHSVHRLSSFNNPAYRFSVNELRRVT